MRAMVFVEHAQRMRWGDQWSDHTLADHMGSLMYDLGEVVNSGDDASRMLALELLFFVSCYLYCMEYYSQHVVASHPQIMRHRLQA